MQEIDFMSSLHKKTNRDYLARVNDKEYPKYKAAELAKKFDFDYWDGDRDICYGGYKYIKGRMDNLVRKMIDYYNLNSNSRILDIGCGKGYLLYDFTRFLPGIKVQGIDISDYAINNSKVSVGPPYFEADFIPLMVPAILLCAFSPMLSWKRAKLENILEMNVVPFDNLSAVLPELRKYDTPVGGVMIAAFTISNNDANGFQISMKSTQGGRLVRTVNGQPISNIRNGDFINYTLNLERGLGGQLGGGMPADNERKNLDLSSEVLVLFDDQLDIATIEAELNLMINTRAKKDIFRGQYTDTITFIIADL